MVLHFSEVVYKYYIKKRKKKKRIKGHRLKWPQGNKNIRQAFQILNEQLEVYVILPCFSLLSGT